MTVCPETETEILRLAFNEEWPVGTISEHLGVHRSVVERVIFQLKNPAFKKVGRSKLIEDHISFIEETMEKYPGIHASRIFVMIKKRGYQGRSASYFRKSVSKLRPKKTQEAFARLSTLPGEQAQVDWAEFGKVNVGKATHKLMAFVMTLSWSRAIFLRFFFQQKCHFFSRVLLMHLNFLKASLA
jgi:transposase